MVEANKSPSPEQLFQVSTKVVLLNPDGKVLVLKAVYDARKHLPSKAKTYTDLPGGRVQVGDIDLEATLRREVIEETGITLPDELTFLYAQLTGSTIFENGVATPVFLFAYVAELHETPPVVLTTEHSAYEWVTPEVAIAELFENFPQGFVDKLKSFFST